MEKKMLFLGPLYPPDQEALVQEKATVKASNAPNVFQWNLLRGLHAHLGDKLQVVNVLPVGSWPKAYKKRVLPTKKWMFDGIFGQEIGGINLPFLKQYVRASKTKKYLKEQADAETEIVVYSAYMPFLKAIYRLPRNIKVTVIVTDLPEFYDLGKNSRLRAFLRKIQNRMIYKYLNRVDRFVVLTKQMCEPLRIGDRPWLRIEGICDSRSDPTSRPQEGVKAILYSGTLHYRYGIKNLLEAFKQINISEAELWICGSGEAANEIRALSERDSRVKFFGFCSQEKVAELRGKAAVLVNPRTNEGEYTKYSFPSKTMEYMASGKPVVMYKLDGIPEEYDEHLFYADAKNVVSGLCNTIAEVLENYDNAFEKAQGAKRFVLANKSGEAQACKLIDFLRE